jgi:hypothetical protein
MHADGELADEAVGGTLPPTRHVAPVAVGWQIRH